MPRLDDRVRQNELSRAGEEGTPSRPIPVLPEDYFAPIEIAKTFKISRTSAINWFEGQPGVIDLGHPETRSKRRYRVLRIPRSALNRFLRERAA